MTRIIDKTIYWRWDRAVRYRPIIRYLKNKYGSSPLTILEVGCGDYSMGLYNGFAVDGLDIRPAKSTVFLSRYIKGSILNVNMPDNSYDIVVSVDVLEHIKPEFRSKAISKMLSIARKEVLIVYPSGDCGERLDKRLYEDYKKRVAGFHIWFDEHLKHGLPKDKDVKEAVELWAIDNQKTEFLIEFEKINGINKHYRYSRYLLASNYVWFQIKNKLLVLYDFFLGSFFKEDSYYRSFCKINLYK